MTSFPYSSPVVRPAQGEKATLLVGCCPCACWSERLWSVRGLVCFCLTHCPFPTGRVHAPALCGHRPVWHTAVHVALVRQMQGVNSSFSGLGSPQPGTAGRHTAGGGKWLCVLDCLHSLPGEGAWMACLLVTLSWLWGLVPSTCLPHPLWRRQRDRSFSSAFSFSLMTPTIGAGLFAPSLPHRCQELSHSGCHLLFSGDC